MLSLRKLAKILLGVEPDLTRAVGLMGQVYVDLGGFGSGYGGFLLVHWVYTNLGFFFWSR